MLARDRTRLLKIVVPGSPLEKIGRLPQVFLGGASNRFVIQRQQPTTRTTFHALLTLQEEESTSGEHVLYYNYVEVLNHQRQQRR